MKTGKTKKRQPIALWLVTGAALTCGYIAVLGAPTASAADEPGDRPAAKDDHKPDGPPRDQEGGGPGKHAQRGDRPPLGPPGVQRALDALDLTAEQKQKIDPIVQAFREKQQKAREDFLKQMKEALTADQYTKLESAMSRPPGPPPQRDGKGEGRDNPPANRPGDNAKARDNSQDRPPGNPPAGPRSERNSENHSDALTSTAKADAGLGVPVTLTGGFDTDPRDHGRPVVLIAAALNVSSDIFRNAFSYVTPASGGREPQPAQVSLNKQALLKNLGPHGVTNDRLDTVSNYYRYSASKGEMWRHKPAVVYAKVQNGVVTGFTITDAGAGYSSPPAVSIAGMDNVKASATLSFGPDFARNGSIKEITPSP